MSASILPLMAFLSTMLHGVPGPQDCEFHLLVRTAGEFDVRRESVADGEVRVFLQSDTLLTPILPWSAGQSGEVVQRSQGLRTRSAVTRVPRESRCRCIRLPRGSCPSSHRARYHDTGCV